MPTLFTRLLQRFATAFAGVTLPGRFEVAQRSPLVVVDGAHNPAGAAVAAQTMAEDFDVTGQRILVVGLLAPRDPVAMLESLEGQPDEDVEAAWAEEIERRVRQLDSGEVKTIPWEQVRANLYARLNDKR